MIKVAVNTRFLLPQLEGIGTFTHEICSRLVKARPDIEFHFLFDRPYDEKYIYAENVVPHVLFPPARHPLLWKMWYEYSIPRKLQQIQADVFYSPDNYCSLSTKVPTLMVTHDLAFEHYPEHIGKSHLSYFKKHSHQFHQRADKIACVSEFTRNDIINRYNVDESKTLVTSNGSGKSINHFSQKEKKEVKERISNGKDYLLFIGALHPRKNVQSLVKAFERFKTKTSSDIKLILVGRMAWKTASLKETIDHSNFKKDIIHLGYVEDVSGILSAANALCYPSLFEGFGIPILDAFQAGVPVLTSNISSIPEVAGKAAVYVNPLDVDDMAKGIQKIVTNTAQNTKLITLGKQRASLFSWEKSAQKTMKALLELISTD